MRIKVNSVLTEYFLTKQDVTTNRYIKDSTQNMLWGIAAGKCQFSGCNKKLWQSEITKEQVNIAQKAHIWAFSVDGPRGNKGIDAEDINDLSNLMLVCHQCHKLIDEDKHGVKYSVDLLLNMKRQHEKRIELATSIPPNKQSHILLYGAKVGEHNSPLNYRVATDAIFPEFYPAESKAFELGMVGSVFEDNESEFWNLERINLERKFNQIIRPGLINNEIKHLSVFGIAPQPLLILLGKLLSDIPPVEIYQLHREPQTWCWQNDNPDVSFEIKEPVYKGSKAIALNLSLSATIDNTRITKVLGDDVSIWTLTITTPNNDFMRSKSQLSEFRRTYRDLMNRIKAVHGHEQTLHVFPAVPVSVALDIGRAWMPKADLPLSLYDEVRVKGGFIKTLDLQQDGVINDH
jgi:hypothetical protein